MYALVPCLADASSNIPVTRIASPLKPPTHDVYLQEDSMSSAIFSANASTGSSAQSLLLEIKDSSTTHRSCSLDALAAE